MASDNRVEKLLEDIKKLLILHLVRHNVPSKDIAAVLKVDPAVISRLVARKKK
jgi:Mn-dependent DtxR family transcriptional regulator